MRRIKQAIEGIREMEQHVDSLLVINNERIREMYGDFAISQAFAKADDILAIAAKGIAEIITVHGYVNVDFSDVNTVMRKSGVAVMGTGIARGEGRALAAVEQALMSPLLNNNDISGAKNILLNITSGDIEVTMDEIGEITEYIQGKAGYNADLIWGNGEDPSLGDQVSVTVIATGFSTSCIPELFSGQKPLKENHLLTETKTKVTDRQNTFSQDIKVEKDQKPQEKESSTEFKITAHQQNKSDYELLYPRNRSGQNEDRKEPRVKVDYSRLTDDDVENLLTVPAYIRKQMKADQSSVLKSPEYSTYSVLADPKKKIIIKDNNPYLHKKVD
jgi:cell division protein FtsZ